MKGLLFFLTAFFMVFSSGTFCRALPADTAYGDAIEDGGQGSVTSAQSTLASLFGEKAVISIPPQIGRDATIAIPSFDSRELEIEKNDLWERN
ncbi:MAG TPA: hypothetical protein PLX96_04710 [Candidatus Omnitrophota bacterium]|nr:hypothetical protein [Candidatus Omnitrophota bacterium]